MKNFLVMLAAAIVVALPFIFRKPPPKTAWQPGDPELVIISPHNEAIRQEFGAAFSDWHLARYGKPVKIDWRMIGGTTEIMRYLAAEYTAAGQYFFRAKNLEWPDDAAFRASDDPVEISSRIDLFFGGGTFDHARAARQSLTVCPWKGTAEILAPSTNELAALRALLDDIPRANSGEDWWTDEYFGTVLSAFGICYNPDRLRDLGVESLPQRWDDLADPKLFRFVGLADPTKSGSVAKAFEMMVHEQIHRHLNDNGYAPERILDFEKQIRALPKDAALTGELAAYQAHVEAGWLRGVHLLQRIGANARYFTDSAGKVPIDVASGAAAAGAVIDFFGRFQAQNSVDRNGHSHMAYITPLGGSSISADPVSLLRGAPHRDLAIRFILFVLSDDGQTLWNYRVGEPGGPQKFPLCRLPISRDFYPPSPDAAEHHLHTLDDLTDPNVDPYQLAQRFQYIPRWTASHFGIQRDLIRAMCMDTGEELRSVWGAILAHGGPDKNPDAMRALERMPDAPFPLTWQSAITEYARADRLDTLRHWADFFRASYREAESLVNKK